VIVNEVKTLLIFKLYPVSAVSVHDSDGKLGAEKGNLEVTLGFRNANDFNFILTIF